MVGQFFNNLLPTSIGGDVVRAWEHSKDTGDVPLSAGSVVSERLIAGVVQGITSVLALVLIPFNPIVATLAVAFLVLDVAFAGLCVLPRFGEAIVRSVLGERFANTADVVSATIAEVRATLGDPSALLRVGVLSMAFQACVAGVNVCLLAALGHPVSLGASLVYTPMIFTLTPLPISISGFGVREASYWYFFGLAGVSKTDAIAASLLFFVAVALFSLPGAPLYFFGRRRGVRS